MELSPILQIFEILEASHISSKIFDASFLLIHIKKYLSCLEKKIVIKRPHIFLENYKDS